MPAGHPDDPFFEQATRQLRERFRIDHVTLQVVREPFMASCDLPLPEGRTDHAPHGTGSHAAHRH